MFVSYVHNNRHRSSCPGHWSHISINNGIKKIGIKQILYKFYGTTLFRSLLRFASPLPPTSRRVCLWLYTALTFAINIENKISKLFWKIKNKSVYIFYQSFKRVACLELIRMHNMRVNRPNKLGNKTKLFPFLKLLLIPDSAINVLLFCVLPTSSPYEVIFIYYKCFCLWIFLVYLGESL